RSRRRRRRWRRRSRRWARSLWPASFASGNGRERVEGPSPHGDGALHHLEVVLAVEAVHARLGGGGQADGGGGVDRQVLGHLGRLEGEIVLHVVGVGDLEGHLLPGRQDHVLGPPDEVHRRLGQRGHGHGQDSVPGRHRRGVLGGAAMLVGGGGRGGAGGGGPPGGGGRPRPGAGGGAAGAEGPADGGDQGDGQQDDDQPGGTLLGHGTSLGGASGSGRGLPGAPRDSPFLAPR